MEHIGVLADGEWDSFSKMFTNEEFDFSNQHFGYCGGGGGGAAATFFPLHHDEQEDVVGLHFPSTTSFCPTSEANVSIFGAGVDNNKNINNESLFFTSSDNILSSNNFLNFSRENSFGGDNSNNSGGDSSNSSSLLFIPTSSHESYFFNDNNNNNLTMNAKDDVAMSMDICVVDQEKIGSHVSAFPPNVNEDSLVGGKFGNVENNNINGQPEARVSPAMESQLKRKSDATALHAGGEDINSFDNSKKKPRVTNRGKKNGQTRQSENGKAKGGEESNGGGGEGSEGQSSSSYSSEEENASQETHGGAITSTSSESKAALALNLNGKPRASRGSATDPQSLYARKRRERINERLKILQNLVPNGTKVDISTMLEEAVQYVKFLQLQIKLLSSDELWIYAPIAYNGMDIGLNQKLNSLL